MVDTLDFDPSARKGDVDQPSLDGDDWSEYDTPAEQSGEPAEEEIKHESELSLKEWALLHSPTFLRDLKAQPNHAIGEYVILAEETSEEIDSPDGFTPQELEEYERVCDRLEKSKQLTSLEIRIAARKEVLSNRPIPKSPPQRQEEAPEIAEEDLTEEIPDSILNLVEQIRDNYFASDYDTLRGMAPSIARMAFMEGQITEGESLALTKLITACLLPSQ